MEFWKNRIKILKKLSKNDKNDQKMVKNGRKVTKKDRIYRNLGKYDFLRGKREPEFNNFIKR